MFIDKCPLCGFDLIYMEHFVNLIGYDNWTFCSNVDLSFGDSYEATIDAHYKIRFLNRKFYMEHFIVENTRIAVYNSFGGFEEGKLSRVICGENYVDLDQYVSPFNLDKVKLYAMLL